MPETLQVEQQARAAVLAWPPIVGPGDFGGRHAAELRGHVNLDYAATTPALWAAVEAVLRLLPAYGSLHRGGGARSRISTQAYEDARDQVRSFLGCGREHEIVFVRNTTEAINLVAASLPRGSRILCSPFEHHANLLPWREHRVDHLSFAATPEALVEETRRRLRRAVDERAPYDLLAVTGASNVTGEVFPIRALVEAAQDVGTSVLVDAAQLAPHRRINVGRIGADYLALSGHKLYAPFGSGALAVRRSLLRAVPPLLKGGGAVRAVTLGDVTWAELPARLEAGTPNLLGAVALAAACAEIELFGQSFIERQEQSLAELLWSGLAAIPGVTVLRLWPNASERVAVASFTVDGHDPRILARRLTDEYGVAVRSGLFCAHPFVSHLLGTPLLAVEAALRARPGEDVLLPGAARASLGLGVQPRDVALLIDALAEIAA